MKLSIIVPIYNVEKYLERCVDSLVDQDIGINDYEIIMVNDGSTDNSKTIAERLVEKHPNVSLYNQENRGLAGARNTGLRYAMGKYVMFVDSDDYLMTNVLSKMVAIAIDNNLDILMARMKVMEADGSFHEGQRQPFVSSIVISGEYALLHGVNIASVCGMLYSSAFLYENNLKFTEGMTHEDVDFNTKCYPVAKRILFSDIISYVYFWNSESLNRSICIEKIIKRYIDDIMIASNTISYVNNYHYSSEIGDIYRKRSNSIICSTFLKLTKDKNLSYKLKLDCINKAKAEGIYPIEGRTLSWKTTFLAKIINLEFFLRLIMRCK